MCFCKSFALFHSDLFPLSPDEIIRQVTVNCAERGLLLLRIRSQGDEGFRIFSPSPPTDTNPPPCGGLCLLLLFLISLPPPENIRVISDQPRNLKRGDCPAPSVVQ